MVVNTKEEIFMRQNQFIEVRLASVEDLKRLVQTSTEVLEDLKKQDKGDWYGGNSAKEFEEAITNENSYCIIAELDGKIVGYLVLNNHHEEDCKKYFLDYPKGRGFCIDGMGVLPNYRNKGVLSCMMNSAKKYALENGKEYFFGTVHPKNDPSILSVTKCCTIVRISDEITNCHMEDGRDLEREYLLAKI